MDTTYFGRGFGVMLFKDASSGVNLYKDYVKTETNQQYAQGVAYLLKQGFTVLAIVCDGRRGLLQLFPTIPVQMCNFHQVAIIRRYLTKKPKMQASKELWVLTLILAHTDKESFEGGLAAWLGGLSKRKKNRRKWQKKICSQKTKKCLQKSQNKLAVVVYMVRQVWFRNTQYDHCN
jgi:hypothetical protein